MYIVYWRNVFFYLKTNFCVVKQENSYYYLANTGFSEYSKQKKQLILVLEVVYD